MLSFEDLKTGKVKLEFGNLEQIRVIKAYEKSVEYAAIMCRECSGEGVITCPCCDGSRKKPVNDKGT